MVTEFSEGMAGELSAFIVDVFDKYVGRDYPEEGHKTFHDYVRPDEIRKRASSGSRIFLYMEEGKITGALELKGENHISLFFVRGDRQNRGIGSLLFSRVLEECRGESLTVNSSPFARKIYENLGFRAVGEVKEQNGIIHIPMIYSPE